MSKLSFPPLRCPVCQNPLELTHKQLNCDNGHSFDIARQGYTNLLLSHKKKSRHPGDDRSMVAARSRFLDSGVYTPFRDEVVQQVAQALQKSESPRIVDVGCGEGYYTAGIREGWPQLDLSRKAPPYIVGVDISKEAIIGACRRRKYLNDDRTTSWLVASAVDLPLESEQWDATICLFSRVAAEEYHRILRAGGAIVVAGAGEHHLQELRESLYTQVRQKSFSVSSTLHSRFQQVALKQIQFSFVISEPELLDALLTMTPHGWRIAPEKKEALVDLVGRPITADITVETWLKV